METLKAKSAAKVVLTAGAELDRLIGEVVDMVDIAVGSTLGPGGCPALLERQEFDVAPVVTKDGVTVFRALGCENSVQHCVLDTYREVAIRTANEAGDGTTTATILGAEIYRRVKAFCKAHPAFSPQAALRQAGAVLDKLLDPVSGEAARMALRPGMDKAEDLQVLRAVAQVSANGDGALADAVLEAFDITGDDGNVTIEEEENTLSRYSVEPISGYPIPVGYEDSCNRFSSVFINDHATQRILLDSPAFLLYFGPLNSIHTVARALEYVHEMWARNQLRTPNVVLVACSFSEAVLEFLVKVWANQGMINMLPVMLPSSFVKNGQRHLLDDIAAVTGGKVFDNTTMPLDNLQIGDLGNTVADAETPNTWLPGPISRVEMGRFRTTIVGHYDDGLIELRAGEVKAAVKESGSILDKTVTEERLARLVGGIAKVKVIGPTSAERKERRDRVEDAVCAVRGALKHGAVPGGGWLLLRLAAKMPATQVAQEILAPAFEAPTRRLLENSGLVGEQAQAVLDKVRASAVSFDDPGSAAEMPAESPDGISRQVSLQKTALVYDAAKGVMVPAVESGILDSLPAVVEAVRNSFSTASVLGTVKAVVVWPRDREFERKDAAHAASFARAAGHNPADDRAM
jgi:chaperonin GroEL